MRAMGNDMQENNFEEQPIFDETFEENLNGAEEGGESKGTVTITVDEYEKLKSDLEEAKDRGLRALAELENFRNRTNRLAAEERKYAGIELARDILPLWDNLSLALQIQDPEKNGEAIVTGVKMVHDDFLKVLDKNGVKKIDAVHKPFDPKFHEAVAFVPTDEFPPNTVMVELKAGFTLHERVVRAAQVVLASAPVKQTEPQSEN